jgi:acetoin utilization protein AcuB
MLMPPISRYMTRQPWTIRRDAPLSQAKDMMREHQIRHLPVLDAGKLVGIVSERDVYQLERFRHLGNHFTVEDAMSEDVYTADPNELVDRVVEAMSEHKYGSAVVMNRHTGVEGIFTTVDGMQVLADVLRRAVA